ncbi:MAG: hypothetical protein ACI9OU_000624 [Candidatus Promineifilaceae bacterium]|jgi:hypothetical protein
MANFGFDARGYRRLNDLADTRALRCGAVMITVVAMFIDCKCGCKKGYSHKKEPYQLDETDFFSLGVHITDKTIDGKKS